MEDVKQLLAQEKFTDQEVEDIMQRAARLQQEAEAAKGRIDRTDLEAGAAEVGISQEFIQQAIQELKAEREREAAQRKKRRLITIGGGIAVAIILVVSLISSHRALNSRMAEVEAKQAQLENVLQRRHDLIPNLISLAKASAAHEEELIASISRLHGESGNAKLFEEKLILEQRMDDSVQQLLSVMRGNPETSSTDVFIRLSDEMAGAENRIAVERKRYNEAVASYNRAARGFPVALLRPLLGFPKSVSFFQASEEAKKAPKF